MPTVHATPGSDVVLQDIADCLWKSKKVLVVTGAGISTNSGIPDFRSENGLYSLIQAQFDAVATLPEAGDMSSASSSCGEEPPIKRRKLSHDDVRCGPESTVMGLTSSPPVINREGQVELIAEDRITAFSLSPLVLEGSSKNADVSLSVQDVSLGVQGSISSTTNPVSQSPGRLSSTTLGSQAQGPASMQTMVATSCSSFTMISKESIESSHSSSTGNSSQSDQPSVPFSSSPLSSPPPILFDPYQDCCPSSPTPGSSGSASSESGESTPQRNPSRNSLPNLKGRELFDAAIWADPLKTSVFYTFTTTLRQKVRNVAPTTSHRFISHLRDTGKLVRCYTQNIDEIEEKVGLTTSLGLGPGSRGRFSRSGGRYSGIHASTKPETGAGCQDPTNPGIPARPTGRDQCDRGVECVFLHGSLRALRCFMCGQISNWDEGDREVETMCGRQPSCPRCQGATAAREERGKRALGVGKLRPDIVLYGEEHPNAHLISPIVQHDLSLAPDMMLILGTSLRVHGLKVMVKEFAKAVHNKGGKVVFVNFTKPPDSVWSDVIDYWVEWDCDAWVDDLKAKKPVMWLPPGSIEEKQDKGVAKKRRDSGRERKVARKSEPRRQSLPVYNPDAKRPAAIRDHKSNGAFLVWKIMEDLARLSGRSVPSSSRQVADFSKAKRKRPRQSAPAQLEQRRKLNVEDVIIVENQSEQKIQKRKPTRPTTLSVQVLSQHITKTDPDTMGGGNPTAGVDPVAEENSILAAVKSNPRKRKRKRIDGVEVELPSNGHRSASTKAKSRLLPLEVPQALGSGADKENATPWQQTDRAISDFSRLFTPLPRFTQNVAALRLPLPKRPLGENQSSQNLPFPELAPLSAERKSAWSPPTRPTPLEPSPTTLQFLSTARSLKTTIPQRRDSSSAYGNPFSLADPLARHLVYPPAWVKDWSPSPTEQLMREHDERAEAAMTLSGLRRGST